MATLARQAAPPSAAWRAAFEEPARERKHDPHLGSKRARARCPRTLAERDISGQIPDTGVLASPALCPPSQCCDRQRSRAESLGQRYADCRLLRLLNVPTRVVAG